MDSTCPKGQIKINTNRCMRASCHNPDVNIPCFRSSYPLCVCSSGNETDLVFDECADPPKCIHKTECTKYTSLQITNCHNNETNY